MPAFAEEGDGHVGRQREQDREAGSDERRDGEHPEHEADVAFGQAGRDGAPTARPRRSKTSTGATR